MGIIVKHVQTHPKTGRLSFRRAYPPELQPFIPGRPTQLRRSLQATHITAPGALAIYEAASAEYESTVSKARRLATGSFDPLDAPTIARLGKVFEIAWLERDERERWEGAADWADRTRAGWDWELEDFKAWRAEGDLEAIVARWGESARGLLSSQGLLVDPAAEDAFTDLCRELNDAALRVSEVSLARLAGEIRQTPTPPPLIERIGGPPARPGRLPLLSTFDAYAKATAITPITAQDWRRCIVHLVDFLGHDDASRLTADDLLRWRDKLLQEPSRRGGTRNAVTVRGKYIGSVKAMLNWAVSERKLPANVALGITVRGPKRHKLRDRDFTDAEAVAILKATFAAPGTGLSPEHARARRWIPWLCAYTGARVNELTQLRGEDVRQIDGIWTVRITPEAGAVKTGEARTVPLHPHLVEQGFPDFAKRLGDGPLFYDPARQRVQADTNRHVKKVGERLAAWVRKDVKITDPSLQPNHGWRHRFKTEARRIKMDPEVRDAIQGHTPGTVGQAYGSMPIEVMAAAIAKLPRYDVTGA